MTDTSYTWDHERALDECQDELRDHAADLEAEGVCGACEGRGTTQDRPDRDGQYDPCDACEGTGRTDWDVPARIEEAA